MTGAQALLQALRAMGVERIFASPGSDWAPLWEALASPEPGFPQYISSRHEETAVAMALGYAKATGTLPAIVLHTTVGSLHATMIVRAALHERIPMVVLAGESIGFGEPPSPKVGRQWLRLLTDVGGPARLMEPCVKWSFALNVAELLPETIQRACQLAASAPRGPVFVSVPTEFLMENIRGEMPRAALPGRPHVSSGALEQLAAELSAARRPVIITEEAGRDAAAVDALVALAEALDAPVIEAWQPYYMNFPRTHRLYQGIVSDGIGDALKDADYIVLVESVLPWHPPSACPAKGAKVAVLGEDPLHPRLPYWGFQCDHVLQGEVAPALLALSRKVTRRSSSTGNEKRSPEKPASKTSVDTACVAHELNAVWPQNAVLVNETITHRLELLKRLEGLSQGGFYEASYGGLGVGLGLALGVKHADPSRPVIVTIGDGAFNYNPVVASFGAAQEHNLPLLVILFNNAGYLSQKSDVAMYYPQGEAVKSKRFVGTGISPRPDYVAIAKAFGGNGEQVSKPSEVRAALERGLAAAAAGRLALIDVLLDPV